MAIPPKSNLETLLMHGIPISGCNGKWVDLDLQQMAAVLPVKLKTPAMNVHDNFVHVYHAW